MFADPDVDLKTTKVECSLSDDDELCAPNELFLPCLYVETAVHSHAETVNYATDNPFCDINELEIPEEDLSGPAKDEIIFVSDGEDVPCPSSVDVKSHTVKKEPESAENSPSCDRHEVALHKFATFLAEHNISDIRSSPDTQLPVHVDILQPNIYSGVSSILGSRLTNSLRCCDDIVVRDNTIEMDIGERLSYKAMKKLKKQAKKMNRLDKTKIEQKEKKNARKMKKTLARPKTEGTAIVAKKKTEEASHHHACGVAMDKKVVSTKDTIVGGTGGASFFTEEPGVVMTRGEELVGMEVEEFSFLENGDIQASTSFKPMPVIPVEDVEDFFGDDFFSGDAVYTATLGTSLEKHDKEPGNRGILPTGPSKEAKNKVTENLIQVVENFDNDIRREESVKIVAEVKPAQKAPRIVAQGTAADVDDSIEVEEVFRVLGEILDEKRKTADKKGEMKKSGRAPVVKSSDDFHDTIVIDDDETQEEPAKKKNEEVVLIEIDNDQSIKWRMIEVERRPSATRTDFFTRFHLPPHNGKKRRYIAQKKGVPPPNIPLESAPNPRVFAVPPPVVHELGTTMFGVPLDHSILAGGIQLKPFSSKSAIANTKKRVFGEVLKRPQMSERLGLTPECWKPKTYAPPPVKWTVEDQWAINRCSSITKEEKELQKKGVIKEYGLLPRDQYQFPFDPYGGLYWPVFQPFDDVELRSEDDADAADVKNQVLDLSVCNYVSKQELLCDAAPNKWKESFLKAAQMTPVEREKNGRFANRVAFARKINDQSRDEMKASDRRKQMEHEERLVEREKLLAEAESQGGEDEGGERLKATETRVFSMQLSDHVRENILDEYSLDKFYCGNRKECVLPANWFKVPRCQYIPANDRRTYLCKLVNHFNKQTKEIITELTGPMPRRGDVRPFDFIWHIVIPVVEANYVHQAMTCHQLCLKDTDRILAKKRKKAIENKFPVGAAVRLEDLRQFLKLQDWEMKYWTFIWDSFASIYKTLPPVCFLIKDIRNPVDEAFKQLARPDHSEEYHKIYLTRRKEYLEKLRKKADEEEEEERRTPRS